MCFKIYAAMMTTETHLAGPVVAEASTAILHCFSFGYIRPFGSEPQILTFCIGRGFHGIPFRNTSGFPKTRCALAGRQKGLNIQRLPFSIRY